MTHSYYETMYILRPDIPEVDDLGRPIRHEIEYDLHL